MIYIRDGIHMYRNFLQKNGSRRRPGTQQQQSPATAQSRIRKGNPLSAFSPATSGAAVHSFRHPGPA